MNYEPWNQDEKSQARKVKARRDVLGGAIKAGTELLAYHKIRVFIQDPKDPGKVARYDVGHDMFDLFFVELEPTKAPPRI